MFDNAPSQGAVTRPHIALSEQRHEPLSQTVAFGFGIGGPIKPPFQIRHLTPRERAILPSFLLAREGAMRQFTKERIAARLTAMRLSDELADLTDELLEMVEDLEDRIRDLESDLDYAEFGTPATAATAKGHPGQGGAA